MIVPPDMSPELAFLLSLALRMAFAAAFVVAASFITERSGPAIGALVATLPVSAGPSYVFLAIDHDDAFIAQSALASLPMNAATILMCLVFVPLAQQRGLAGQSRRRASRSGFSSPRWCARSSGRCRRHPAQCRRARRSACRWCSASVAPRCR